jgi:hypothetical protein
VNLGEFVRVLGEPQRGPRIQGTRTFATARDGSPAAYWPADGFGVFYERREQTVWALVVFEPESCVKMLRFGIDRCARERV